MKGVESLGCQSEPKSEPDRVFCVHTQSFLKGAKKATTIYCVVSTVFNTLYAVVVFWFCGCRLLFSFYSIIGHR